MSSSSSDSEGEPPARVRSPYSAELLRIVLRDPRRLSELNNMYLPSMLECDSEGDVAILLSIGYNIKVIRDRLHMRKETLIHRAFLGNCRRILQIPRIFSFCENDTDYITSYGLSHLHVACAVGNIDAVRNYVQRGGHLSLPCKNFDNFTPLHFAAKNERREIVEILLKNGAEADALSSIQQNPFHLACQTNSDMQRIDLATEMTNPTNEGLRVMEILIDHGLKFDKSKILYQLFRGDFYDKFKVLKARSKNGTRILNVICRRQKEKLEFLISQGAVAKGTTVLNRAIKLNLEIARDPKFYENMSFDDSILTEIVEILLSAQADANALDQSGKSPLQYAVHNFSVDIVKSLLQHGADGNNLDLSRKFGSTFNYPGIFPVLEVVENTMEIVELLPNKARSLMSHRDSGYLEFLLYTGEHSEYNHDENIKYKLKILLTHGFALDINMALGRMSYFERGFNEKYMKKLYSIYSHFYMEGDKLRITFPHVQPAELSENQVAEIELMKRTRLSEAISLYDILMMNTADIYRHIMANDYRKITRARDFDEKFKNFGLVIKGHIVKSLIRRYLITSAIVSFKHLTSNRLPDTCCMMILSYLIDFSDLVNIWYAGL